MASETNVPGDDGTLPREQSARPGSDQLLGDWFTDLAEQYSDLPAAYFRSDDSFVTRSFDEVFTEAKAVAGGLQELGLEPGDQLAICSSTRYEWSVVDVAAMISGVVLVPIYTTFSATDTAYVIEDAGADFLIAEDTDVAPEVADAVEEVFDIRSLPEGEFQEPADGYSDPADVAALIYTSGTTGNPKGVKLTHRNIQAELDILRDTVPAVEPGGKGSCYLPLAALAQRMFTLMLWDQGQASVYMSTDTLVEDLSDTQPEILMGVPRVWRRMHSGIHDQVAGMSGVKESLVRWGLDVALDYGSARERNSVPKSLELKRELADKLVYSKIRGMLGLSNVEYALTGAASLDAEVLHFFWGLGVPLIEVYGATETTAVCVGNRMEDFRAGTVGKPSSGVEVRLDDDGEVLVRGPIVMDGYWNLPEKTEEALEDGWYRTGDIGEWDGEYLAIIDRKKFKAVLDTGQNIYPEPIETPLRRSPYIEEAMIVADDRKFVSALIQPNFEQLLALADENGIEYDETAIERSEEEIAAVPSELVEHATVKEIIEEEIGRINQDLAEEETVKKFTLIERSLRIDNEELTPTLKKRREAITENFTDRIEAMYDD